MLLRMKITCTCHQAKMAMCCQLPNAPKICTVELFNMLNPNLQSDLLSDNSRRTSFNTSYYTLVGNYNC